ncbi:MAG: cation:proton antiporter [Chloroflexota bacterium]|nr:cation:proton antiporter [Chloroflexota bacterium]
MPNGPLVLSLHNWRRRVSHGTEGYGWELVAGAVVTSLEGPWWCVLVHGIAPWVIERWGKRISEPEVKFFFLVLFVLGGLATTAKSEAVLPAYLIGLVTAGVFVKERALLHRVRIVAFALLTPFYFLKAGLYVALTAVVASLGWILALLGVKVAAKFVDVWPAARAFRMAAREGNYTTLLMSTGLTFGTISALFGLTNGYISQAQYTILVTVVIGSAVAPTLVAQAWFRPKVAPAREATAPSHPPQVTIAGASGPPDDPAQEEPRQR